VLVVIHRWLGIALGPLVAMWFATGMVMHFVPFPTLSESQRVAGLSALKIEGSIHGPADSIPTFGMTDVHRIRLVQRADGPVYIVSGGAASTALRAANLAPAAVRSRELALAIAADDTRQRGKAAPDPARLALIDHDQWTVAGHYQRHRPLYRIALDDEAGTEFYISSTTGEVVLDTTRWERRWNFIGSVAHWIYAPPLRSRPALWSAIVTWLSLAAFALVVAGAILGVARVRIGSKRSASPYHGMHWWHHMLGLSSLIFVTTWIFSGFLSMDDGVLFSTGRAAAPELSGISGAPSWDRLKDEDLQRIDPRARELEWFAFGGRLFRREITAPNTQHIAEVGHSEPEQAFLPLAAVGLVARRLGPQCGDPAEIGPNDNYAMTSVVSGAPVYRITCGSVWYDLDAASGALLQTTDTSRRAYRWLYSGLHRLDFPALAARPVLRTVLIIILCGIGLVFSLTGIAVGARRLWRRA
jgi:PepSY-associated TM region